MLDQDALVNALKTGQIGGAGLDVMTPEPLPPDHELTKLKNCGKSLKKCLQKKSLVKLMIMMIVLIPHIGSATVQTRTAMANLTAQNIINALEGKKMPAQVC